MEVARCQLFTCSVCTVWFSPLCTSPMSAYHSPVAYFTVESLQSGIAIRCACCFTSPHICIQHPHVRWYHLFDCTVRYQQLVLAVCENTTWHVACGSKVDKFGLPVPKPGWTQKCTRLCTCAYCLRTTLALWYHTLAWECVAHVSRFANIYIYIHIYIDYGGGIK